MQQGSRFRLPPDLARLSRDEWEQILDQAMFCELDAGIVRNYIMLGMSQVDTGTEVDRVRSTIYRRRGKILERAREVAKNLNMI